MRFCLGLLLLLVVDLRVESLDNGLALTPPMGWISWERFRCNIDCQNDPDNCISERLYKHMADLIVSKGFAAAGYVHVNIDDCWMSKERDADGRLVADPVRFPNGIKALARYMHSKGLKLGIYGDFGTKTCAGYPGSEFYMKIDADTVASWDVDMFKFDGCNSDAKDMKYGYPLMQHFLNQTGRAMVYSCEWPLYEWSQNLPRSSYTEIAKSCNMFRNYKDLTDAWYRVTDVIDYYGDDVGNFSAVSGPGAWNDPGLLVVGDFGLSDYQQRAQMGMWAMFAAPLMMSVDLRTVTPAAEKLLQNKNIIAINQDPLGDMAVRLFEVPGSISVWIKRLVHPTPGSVAIAILNKDDAGVPTVLPTSMSELGFKHPGGYKLTEVFDYLPMGKVALNQTFSVKVDPTSVFIFIAQPL